MSSLMPAQFINRFTLAERNAIRASANAAVTDWLFRLPHNYKFVTTDATLVSDMQFLVTQGLLTQARMNAILA